ncbi:hypothetical protein [Maribacter cobaltidurans]|uniref:Uncharacterized protein n=1 Tax=Maribacter cobaltidurans TaxID=1178778 RepID=A0A223V632_9FLAO|nr:hypothetical protein [Maribacter cobaltidurans]ASV30776.1 hypothetical protein CJ263_11420 [Maribacter cobaltidurans]GGD81643.1 hypothetical protein GCM10011412_19280 [Maribacter cobaltidurans]
MKKLLMIAGIGALIVSCNVKKEEKGEMPELDVDVMADAGELPEYDVNWADIDVGTTTKTVSVPKVVVVMEEEEVEVPYIDVDMPEGDSTQIEERTIMVEAEVTDTEHNIDIRKIFASGNKLYVVSELTSTDTSIGDKTMRVSDQVVLKAPEMDVKYIIVGERPDSMFNSKYEYVANMSEIDKDMKDSKVIYEK